MENENLKSYDKLNSLNISRETFLDFEYFISMLIEKNKQINIVSEKSSKNSLIRNRHVIDSAQIIEFIDLNSDSTTDLGTGGGLPGIIIAIMLKRIKKKMKVHLYEKSHNKGVFLREVSKKLNLETEIYKKDVFKLKNLKTGTVMSRAFKPMPIVLDLIFKNFNNHKNLIFFMGKTGKKIFKNILNNWDLEYVEKKSITNEESFLLNIKKIKKKTNANYFSY